MRLSLRTKWTLTLLLVGALPLAALAVTTIGIQRRGLERGERDLETSMIAQVGQVVDTTLDEASEATHRVGQLLTDGRVAEDEARLDLARDAMARAEALHVVTIYKPDGTPMGTIARKNAPPGEADAPPAPLPPPALTHADPESGFWLPPLYEKGSPTLRFIERVQRDGEVRAWVVGTLSGDSLARRMDGISRDEFEDQPGRVLLLDGEARLLAGGGALPIGESLVGKDLFQTVKLTGGSPFAQNYASAGEYLAADGTPMVGGVRSLPRHGWGVAVRRPASEVFKALADARNGLLIAAGSFAVLALLAGSWLARRTTRPVEQLVALTKAYADRKFSERSPVRTGDELETLGTSLVAMADQLSASEKEILRRAAVEKDLSRFLPEEVAKAIAGGTQKLALGGERRNVTVLFADVVSFTTFAEKAGPEKVVAFLNELFTVLTEVVFRHGGTVDKFMGDCMMCFFGAPADQPDHASRAVAAAEDMQRFVEASAPAWKDKFGIEVKIGIGINSGEALVGNLGSDARMEYTVIGDVVNVAARLEALARPSQTLVTDVVAQAVGDDFVLAPMGEHALRGKEQVVKILELQS